MTTTHTHAGTDASECTTCTSQRPTPTPKDLKEAWEALMVDLERQLLATRANARARTRAEVWPQPALTQWQATAWAATRILEQVKGLPVPEVPVDHTEGQASILDAIAEDPICWMWQYPDTWPHAVTSLADTRVTKDPEAVTCPGCRAAISPPSPSTSGDEPVEHRPRRLLDREGELWEELETGRWGYCPQGSDPINGGPYEDGPGPGSDLYGPVETLEELVRAWGPLREPEGDEYDRGARDDE